MFYYLKAKLLFLITFSYFPYSFRYENSISILNLITHFVKFMFYIIFIRNHSLIQCFFNTICLFNSFSRLPFDGIIFSVRLNNRFWQIQLNRCAFLLISSSTIEPLGAIVGYLRNISSSGYNNILKLSGQFFTLFSNEHLLAYPSASLSKIAINLDLILEK